MAIVSRVNAYYQSETENAVDQESVLNETHDDFWLWSGSVALVTQNWNISLYGKTLGAENGETGSLPSTYFSNDKGVFEGWYGNSNRQMITQPRTIGLSASYHF